MTLIPDWKLVLAKGWSLRWLALAAFLGGVETFLPNFADLFPTKTFGALSFVVTCIAGFARLLAQPEISGDAAK